MEEKHVSSRGRGEASDSRPSPDPTLLTTEQLHREVEVIRELIESKFSCMDKLLGEKFRSVDQKFETLEKLRVEQKFDSQTAVNAALQAQKESVREQTVASDRSIAKSESATMKQLEQLQLAFTAAVEGLRREISDLKERVAEVDAKVGGAQMQKLGAKEDRTGLYAAFGFIFVLLSIAAVIVAFVRH